MSAFADFLDLRLAVAEHVGRTDLSDIMPRFVKMAEAKLNKRLRVNQQITASTLTFTDGAADLPADFAEIIHVYDQHGGQMRAGSIAGTKQPGSVYHRYAIRGDQMIIHGISGTRDIVYFAKLPTLTSGISATNWLLEDAPDVYLYAVGFEAARHIRDVEMATLTQNLLNAAVSDLERNDMKVRWANATVKPQMVTP